MELVGAGKGGKYRPVDRKAWEAGWKRCFGRKLDYSPRTAQRSKTVSTALTNNSKLKRA